MLLDSDDIIKVQTNQQVEDLIILAHWWHDGSVVFLPLRFINPLRTRFGDHDILQVTWTLGIKKAFSTDYMSREGILEIVRKELDKYNRQNHERRAKINIDEYKTKYIQSIINSQRFQDFLSIT